jgi:hypothetical protein
MFDWSTLKRGDIIDHLLVLSPKLCDCTISPIEFHNTLSKFIKKYLPVTITIGWDIKVRSYKVFVGGTYYSDQDENDKKCIELNFFYNPEYTEFTVSKRRYKGMCSTIADTILHEVIHMRQYRRRSFKELPNYASTAASSKIREEQSYLGCTDEIDAYSFNIACELTSKFKGNYKSIVKHLNTDLKSTRRDGGSWKMYLKAFNHDHKHEIIKRVKKKVIRYLPRAEEGKPFKSCDWICY